MRSSRSLVGFCGFKEIRDQIDFGYRLSVDSWGRGIATEAAKATIDYAWKELRLRTLTAGVMPANRASLNVLLKLCFSELKNTNHLDQSFDWYGLSARPHI